MNRYSIVSILANYGRYLSFKNKISILLFAILSSFLTMLELVGIWISVKVIEITRLIVDDAEISNLKFPLFLKVLKNLELSQALFMLAASAFTIFLIRSILQIMISRHLLHTLGIVAASISIRGMTNLVKKNILSNDHKKLSEIEYSLTTGIDKAILTIFGSLAILISDAFLILFSISALFRYDWLTGIVLLMFGLISFLIVNRFATKKLKKIGIEKTNLDISVSTKLRDTLSIAGEARQTKMFCSFVTDLESKRFRQGNLYGLQTIFPYISKYVIEMNFLLFAAILTFFKLVTGTFVDAASALGLLLLGGSRLTPALLRIQQSLQAIVGALGPAERALDTLSIGETVAKQVQSRQFCSSPNISMNKVSFQWNENSKLFNEISLELKSNSLICLVGRSGIGKTTMIRLILGDLKPISGSIAFTGLSESDNSEGRYPVYVPQDPHLLDANLLTNLFISDELIEEEICKIERILKNLELGKLLNVFEIELGRFKNSREQITSESHLHQLSRGEKQRLGIARALIQKSYLYIFDEPSSALDEVSALKAISLIKELSKNATVICVTHDERLMKVSDHLIDFEKFLI